MENLQTEHYGIEMDKMFKFNSSHFVVYKGFREPLHGHNYKVSIKIKAKKLNSCYYVCDFHIVSDLMREICAKLKHVCLLPKNNPFVKITAHSTDKTNEKVYDLNDTATLEKERDTINVTVATEDGSVFTFPYNDVKIIETEQISAECMSKYVAHALMYQFEEKYPENAKDIQITKMTCKVAEDKGMAGVYSMVFKP